MALDLGLGWLSLGAVLFGVALSGVGRPNPRELIVVDRRLQHLGEPRASGSGCQRDPERPDDVDEEV